MSDERPWRIVPTEWEVRYPVEAEPIGVIRRERHGGRERFRATGQGSSSIGTFPDGDSAVVAIWEAFLAAGRTQHEHASRTHGGAGRHPNNGTRPRSPGEG